MLNSLFKAHHNMYTYVFLYKYLFVMHIYPEREVVQGMTARNLFMGPASKALGSRMERAQKGSLNPAKC